MKKPPAEFWDMMGFVAPEPNPQLELRVFTTFQGEQPRWRRRYCRACNSSGEWRDSLMLAVADLNTHPSHGE